MQSSGPSRYIIVGMARSGTTAVHNGIFGHPHVCAMADEFRVDPFFTKGIACFTVGGHNVWERERNYGALFDAVTLYKAEAPDPEGKRLIAYNGTPELPKREIKANGLKVAIPNAEDAKLLVDSLQKYFPSIRVIHVQRDDWVAQYASLRRAERSGVWHTRGEKTAAPTTKPADDKMTLAKAPFAHYLEMATEVERQLERLHTSHESCRFSYENELLTGDTTAAMHRLFEFLSVDAIDPTWMRLTKTAPPLDQFVTNVAELREMMAAHRGTRA